MEPRSFDRGDEADPPGLAVELAPPSMEPRSFDRGDILIGDRKPQVAFGLQWSRGLLTAETNPTVRFVPFHPVPSMEPRSFDRGDCQVVAAMAAQSHLQWSRGLLTAETGRNLSFSHLLGDLQWSRGLLTAETCVIRSVSSSCRAFNGAAVF